MGRRLERPVEFWQRQGKGRVRVVVLEMEVLGEVERGRLL